MPDPATQTDILRIERALEVGFRHINDRLDRQNGRIGKCEQKYAEIDAHLEFSDTAIEKMRCDGCELANAARAAVQAGDKQQRKLTVWDALIVLGTITMTASTLVFLGFHK